MRHSRLRVDHKRKIGQQQQRRRDDERRVHAADYNSRRPLTAVRRVVSGDYQRRTGNRPERSTTVQYGGRVFVGRRPQARLSQGARQKQIVPAIQTGRDYRETQFVNDNRTNNYVYNIYDVYFRRRLTAGPSRMIRNILARVHELCFLKKKKKIEFFKLKKNR